MSIVYLLLAIRAILKLVSWNIVAHSYFKPGLATSREERVRNEKNLVILVKVFQEENRIGDLVDRLFGVLSIDPRISALIVGTSKERVEDRNPTIERAKELCAGLNKITVMEAAFSGGNSRSIQLNEAINCVSGDESLTWVLHADVDTRFCHEGIVDIFRLANTDTRVIQQSSLFTANFADLSYLQTGHAIFQSRWTLAHETLRLAARRRLSLVLAHVVGHGCCIRLDLLRQVGGWPTALKTEDIQMGYNLCVLGEDIALSRHFELSDTPTRFWDGFRQQIAWSQGALNYFIYPGQIPFDLSTRAAVRNGILGVQGIVLWANWMLLSWLFAIGIIRTTQGDVAAAIFVLVYVSDYLLASHFIGNRSKIGFGRMVSYLPSVLIAILVRSLAANIGLFVRLSGIASGEHKTRI